MSTSRKTRALAPVADATAMAFESELLQLRRITARERQLRTSLEALEKRASERFLETVDKATTNDLGYADNQDRAWRDWISVRRSNLQSELAIVLAEKTDRMTSLARSLGRKDIAARMHAQSREEDRRQALADQLAELQELMVMMTAGRERTRLN